MSDNVFVDTNILLSWWDSLIVAAAEAAACARILSEDLSDGASYFGITVENPFNALS